jgi:hypothetical protein
MDLGVHLPLMQFGSEELSVGRLEQTVDAASDCGFTAVSANDHFIFQTPWLDGPTALASMIERSGEMTLATTLSLAVLRGPVALAKTLAALDILSEGRLIAALGPGSSRRDYEALGIPFDERWKRFDEVIPTLRALLNRGPGPSAARYYPVPSELELAPRTGARAATGARRTPVGRKLGIEGRASPGRESRGRLACLRVQHDPGEVLRGPSAVGARAGRPRPRAGGLSERPRDDVDLGCQGIEQKQIGCWPRLSRRCSSQPRRAPRPGMRRARGALLGSSLSLCAGGVRTRLPVAIGR